MWHPNSKLCSATETPLRLPPYCPSHVSVTHREDKRTNTTGVPLPATLLRQELWSVTSREEKEASFLTFQSLQTDLSPTPLYLESARCPRGRTWASSFSRDNHRILAQPSGHADVPWRRLCTQWGPRRLGIGLVFLQSRSLKQRRAREQNKVPRRAAVGVHVQPPCSVQGQRCAQGQRVTGHSRPPHRGAGARGPGARREPILRFQYCALA